MTTHSSNPLKTRFCPSPTGHMHLGNVRTALFNALLAKNLHGQFLLRIEDTDRERSEERFSAMVMQDMQWLGMPWDEGPYYQSQRQNEYDKYYQILEEMNLAYPCFCSEDDLALMRKIQRSTGKPPRYAGTCRNLSPGEIESKRAQGLKPALRFRVPDDTVVQFEDMVHGLQRFQTNDIGDFIIRRADGTPPFLYCNAIDDALMGVTHVVRGEDHLANTPRQILILQALKLPIAKYGHIPMILGSDGSPLAKRHGSQSVVEMRDNGYLPIAIINYLARLGHYYGHDEYKTIDQLASEFKIENLNKSPAKFNLEQLNHWQKESVMRLDEKSMWQWLGSDIQAMVPEAQRAAFIDTVQPNVLFPRDAYYWAKVIFNDDFTIDTDEVHILRHAGADYFKVALSALEQSGPDLAEMIKHLKQVLGLQGENLYSPLRVALTGKKHGPELKKVFKLLSPDEIRLRLQKAV